MPRKGMGKKQQCDSCGARWACRRWVRFPEGKDEIVIPVCSLCNELYIRRLGKYGTWENAVPLDKDGKITEEVRANARRDGEEGVGERAAAQDLAGRANRLQDRVDRLLAVRRRRRRAVAREVLPNDG